MPTTNKRPKDQTESKGDKHPSSNKGIVEAGKDVADSTKALTHFHDNLLKNVTHLGGLPSQTLTGATAGFFVATVATGILYALGYKTLITLDSGISFAFLSSSSGAILFFRNRYSLLTTEIERVKNQAVYELKQKVLNDTLENLGRIQEIRSKSPPSDQMDNLLKEAIENVRAAQEDLISPERRVSHAKIAELQAKIIKLESAQRDLSKRLSKAEEDLEAKAATSIATEVHPDDIETPLQAIESTLSGDQNPPETTVRPTAATDSGAIKPAAVRAGRSNPN